MRISVHCHACGASKRPLTTCESCGAASAGGERTAWRAALAERCRTRMAAPRRPTPLPRIPRTAPREVVITLVEPARPALELVSPLSLPQVAPSEPRSFDWRERRRLRLLRRSAA